MVQAIGVRRPGGPDALGELDLAAEPIGPGRVRIRVSSATVNPAGATVAVTGAAGTVGGYFVQLAKQAGLVVVADAAQRDETFVRECGADEVVPRDDDFAATVRRHHPGGVDGLLDAAGLEAAVLPAR
ncbi:zinc-binding dehydrogenase, partial [Nonomuraea sp. NPDC001023]|uniref:zinc-binding dehydrogenase n=1 Tax=Nonomuraea sp. NPDC001023 TaxID=3154770 RepID=UPI00332B1150